MSLIIRQATQFRRDMKRLQRQGADLSRLRAVIASLAAQKQLDERYRDHALTGNGYLLPLTAPYWMKRSCSNRFSQFHCFE